MSLAATPKKPPHAAASKSAKKHKVKPKHKKAKPKPLTAKAEGQLARKNASLFLFDLASGNLPKLCQEMSPAWRARYSASACQPLNAADGQRFSDQQASESLGRASSAARDAAKANGGSYPIDSLVQQIEAAEPELTAIEVSSPSQMIGQAETVIGIDTALSDSEHVFLYIHSRSGKVLKLVGDLTGEAVSDTGLSGSPQSSKPSKPSVKLTSFQPLGQRSFDLQATVNYGIGGSEQVYIQVHALTPYASSRWQVTQIDTRMLVAGS